MAGVGFLQSLWEMPTWEGVWPHLDPMDSVCFTHCVREVECAGGVRESLLQGCHPHPVFSADVLKKCALIAWKMSCPKSPRLESEGEAWSEDEGASPTASREGNVGHDALHVIRLHGHGGKISLFLEDWELAKVASSCHIALDMLCQEIHDAW